MNKRRMMQTHNFICDCQECIDDSHQFKLSITTPPVEYMSRNNFARGKEYLKDGWKVINANKQSQKTIDVSRRRNLQILYTLAYYATFPY